MTGGGGRDRIWTCDLSRSRGFATARALQAQLTHEPLDGAAGHRDPFAVQLPPDLADALDAKVLGMDAADLDLQLRVADRTS